MLSSSEKQKQTQNFVEKRQLHLARQDLDRQLERKQCQLRREVEMLTDQFLDQRAFPGSRLYPKRSCKEPLKFMNRDDPGEKIKQSEDPEEQYRSLDIYEKFVVQKRKYYPSYLKRPVKLHKSAPRLEGIK